MERGGFRYASPRLRFTSRRINNHRQTLKYLMQPLHGIRVLDFSTLLPGPLATLMLAEAGAEVIKIERPGRGDEMRSYEPKFGTDSVNFALLNRGKRSVEIDLKKPGAVERLKPLLESADVV